ncbi:hypothetical protein ABK040_003275 [Willaertia magna]
MSKLNTTSNTRERVLKFALNKIKLETIGKTTLIVGSSKIIKVENSRETLNKLFKTFQRVNKWSSWSQPLHLNTTYSTNDTEFKVGLEFEQELNLGFPLGKNISKEKISELEINDNRVLIAWHKDESGVKSCHVWQYEILNDTEVEIINTEVFHGIPILFIKPFVSKRWNTLFEQSVNGLIEETEKKE